MYACVDQNLLYLPQLRESDSFEFARCVRERATCACVCNYLTCVCNVMLIQIVFARAAGRRVTEPVGSGLRRSCKYVRAPERADAPIHTMDAQIFLRDLSLPIVAL